MPTDSHPDSYFPALEDDSSWASEQLWCHLRDAESIPNRVPDNVPFYPTEMYKNMSRSSLASSQARPSNSYADLARITEHEKWNNPAPRTVEHETAPKEQYLSYSSTSSPQPDSLVPFCGISRAYSDPKYSKSLDRSQLSSSSEGQPHRKRRQSWDAQSMLDPDVQLEEDMEAVKPAQSSKIGHSVIERRYRENLNTKITQLDQALISTCHHKCLSSDGKPVEGTSKTRKADVLTDAIKYVKQTELESKARMQEISFLRLRVAALEKLVNCGDCAALKQFTGLQVRQSL